MKHNCPTFRDAAAYLPVQSTGATLTRVDVCQLMDKVFSEAEHYSREIEECLKSTLQEYTISVDNHLPARRVMTVTEFVDFPQFLISRNSRTILFRTCLSACPDRVDGPGRHKIWSRASLVDGGGWDSPPATDLEVNEVIEFYETARKVSEELRPRLWSRFSKFASEFIPGLEYDKNDVRLLRIEFDETEDVAVFRTIERLRRGSTIKDVVEDADEPSGYKMFMDMYRIAAGNKAIDADMASLKNFIRREEVKVNDFRPPYLFEPTYFFEHSLSPKEVVISGTSYATEPVAENKVGVYGRHAFISSRNFMEWRGGNI